MTLLDDSRAAKATTRRWPPILGLLTSICAVPAGASGKLDPIMSQEYGSQDFFGVIDELRIWRTVRNEDQIKQARFTLCPIWKHLSINPCMTLSSVWGMQTCTNTAEGVTSAAYL